MTGLHAALKSAVEQLDRTQHPLECENYLQCVPLTAYPGRFDVRFSRWSLEWRVCSSGQA